MISHPIDCHCETCNAYGPFEAYANGASETCERLCVNCGKTALAKRGDVLPECVGPDGMAACTFDMTDTEAALFWRRKWHEQHEELRDWRSAALRVGEQLATDGPPGYYEFTPGQWLQWALITINHDQTKGPKGTG